MTTTKTNGTKKNADTLKATSVTVKKLSARDLKSLAKKAAIEAKAAAKNAPKAAAPAPITVPADMGANAKFPFAVLCIAAKDSSVSYERFQTAKARDLRLRVLEADKTLSAARAENYTPAPAAVTPAPAKAAKPAKAPKAPKAPADAVLKVRLYSKGEFYFGKHVAARMAGMTHVAIEANGKKVTLTPTKSTKDTFALMYCHKAPVLRVKEALKDLGIVTVATQDLVAKPVGETAFTVEVK